MPERTVRQTIIVETIPEVAFDAVTRASELREWCCEQAWTEVRPAGRYDLRWASGYHADCKFTAVDRPRRAAVAWRGSGEPGETTVEFLIEPADAGTRLTIVHGGFGPGSEWDKAVAESQQGWQAGLENLKSTVETGIDLRIARRPFLGITFDVLTPERAAKEDIAAQEGIYVEATVEDSGARAAGLAKADVIVSIGGIPTRGFQELGAALGRHQAGDVVDMEIVHGHERRTLPVTLGRRPMEEVPGTAAELAQTIAARYQELNADLLNSVEGVSDDEAGRRPAEGEWSVKEVLAHLSLSERDLQFAMATFATAGWLDEGPDHIPGRLAAVLTVAPTLQALVERFFADEAETVAFVRELPPQVAGHRARFRRIGQQVAYMPNHTCEHIDQIKATVQAVRAA